MYFVNRSDIEKILVNFDELLTRTESNLSYNTVQEKLGLERLIHVLIESIIDVGNLMIDGFIMRDPGSYHDIVDILIDEKVIPQKDEASYKALIDLRQAIVQNYLAIDHEKLIKVLQANSVVYQQFSAQVRHYLNNELGVANAFTNEP